MTRANSMEVECDQSWQHRGSVAWHPLCVCRRVSCSMWCALWSRRSITTRPGLCSTSWRRRAAGSHPCSKSTSPASLATCRWPSEFTGGRSLGSALHALWILCSPLHLKWTQVVSWFNRVHIVFNNLTKMRCLFPGFENLGTNECHFCPRSWKVREFMIIIVNK